uniref:Putative single-stranded dna-binding replication protein a rpa medium 30 kd subunit n=1 Tax=Tabanus bromius TaxID=304241 RepID=A0A0K8TSG2_TABBR
MNDTFGGNPFNTTTDGAGAQSEQKAEGVVPVLIKQILQSSEGNFQMWGMAFGIIQTVSIVRNVDSSATKITYLLEDHTGQIDAHYWLEEGDTQKAPDVMVNCYARVYGTVRQLGGKKTMMIFKMIPVASLNEVTTHLLEVLNARYKAEEYSKKGNSGLNDFSHAGVPTSFHMQTDDNHGLEGKQLVVFQAIKNHGSEEGISRMELQRKFSHIASHELQNILDYMTQEGHIYTSIDAEHFLSTDA